MKNSVFLSRTLPKSRTNTTLMEGIVVALIASFIGSVGYFALSSVLSNSFSIRFLISGLSGFYILYLLARTNERVGRVSTLLLFSAISMGLWLFWPSITLFIWANLLMIWLIRSLYFYTSLFSSIADLFLQGFSLTTALWAFAHTQSLFIGIWCFFLIQALFVLIANKKTNQKCISSAKSTINNEANFQRAYRDAENAVRKLSV